VNKNNVLKAAAAFAFLTALAVGYQNCGANSGSFNIGQAETASSGTITNNTMVAGPIAGGGSATANGGHTCAINSSGAVKCWGDNATGQLGNGDVGRLSMAAGPLVPALPAVAVKVIANNTNSCALLINGLVYCWGDNTYGQLGNGQTGTQAFNPTPVSIFPGAVVDIALTAGTLCGVTHTGVIACAGTNGDGELGITGASSSLTAVYVSGITNAVKITGNTSHFCATESTGAIWCWGGGADPVNLGNDTTTVTASLPVNVLGVAGQPLSVVTGPIDTCLTLFSGGTQCFGDNTYGQLGLGSGNVSQTSLISTVIGGHNFSNIAVSTGTNCGLTTSGQIYCWGLWGTTNEPTPVGPLKYSTYSSGFTAIGGGPVHQCALINGNAVCWGANATGELGNNTATPSLTATVAVVNFP
jgi:alpha-tubulin suppressor-like RCC1 family protein